MDSLNISCKDLIDNMLTLVQVMAWQQAITWTTVDPDLCCHVAHNVLTHWGRDKMAAIFQTTLLNEFF